MQSIRPLRLIAKQLQSLNSATNLRVAWRTAGQYQRKQLIKHGQLDYVKTQFLAGRQELSADEWRELREELFQQHRHIGEHNVDAVVMGLCTEAHFLPLAKNYLDCLRNEGKEPNLVSLGRLLRAYNASYHAKGGRPDSLSATEQQEILTVCNGIRQQHELLDADTCEHLIFGLVATEEWRQGLELFEMIRMTAKPTTLVYNELTVKAFNVGDIECGLRLLEQAVQRDGKQPKCQSFIAYLDAIATAEGGADAFVVGFQRLMDFLQSEGLIISELVAQHLQRLAVSRASVSDVIHVSTTQLKRPGKCMSCGQFLQNVSVSEEEFAQLRDSFLDKVLIRHDVFQKSTPQEVDRFKRFVNETGPYDCVIDGLNVAFSQGNKKSPLAYANLLANVVKYFQKHNKHVLVLGRKHMNRWPAEPMQFIARNAQIFLANDLSQDDPFLLYAALKSGPSTDFFSRDLMRAHAHLLGGELKAIFRRWQQEHQYSLITQVNHSNKILVREPVRHLTCAHLINEHWHVPYKTTYSANPSETFEVPDKWLCIKIQ